MTLEEKAEEFTRKNSKGLPQDLFNSLVKLFVEFAKENGVIWHNLKENPDDLPKVKEGKSAGGEPYHISNVVQNQKGQHCWYNHKYNKWCDNDYILDEVIAWCEIPQFEE